MSLSLKIFVRDAEGLRFLGEHPLEGTAVTLGRSKQCTVPLEDPDRTLSRTHLSFEPAGAGWRLQVVSQHNGVRVNGEEQGPGSTVLLKAGDTVAMDKYELEIVRSAVAEPEPDPEATVAVRRSSATPAPAASPTASPPPRPRATVPPAAPAPAPRAAAAVSIPAGLSATRLADLPGASPFATGMGGAGEEVQIASLQAGHVLAGRFRVEEQIGAGGMGAVYRAHDQLRGEDIALKVMLPGLLASEQAKQRFMNEAKIALRLRHPGIVSVHDVQADGAYLFLTMELLRGKTLRDAMEERKRAGQKWTEAEALAVIAPVCEALAYAHQHTVHRDIKPENVWLCEDGSVKLMDFGIARVLSGSQMTQTAAVMGTAYYMAPEQLAGLREVDHRADQYSLGVMLYEMLAERIPAGRIESLAEVRDDASQGLSDAVDRALSGKMEQRFPGDAEFLAALRTPAPRAGVPSMKAIGRRTGLSPAATRQVGIGIAALAGVLVLALLWPVLRGVFPDREAEKKAELEAARLDAEAKSLLKLLENDRRELKEAVSASARDAERIEGQLRSVRSAPERAALEGPLREARDKAAFNEGLERKLRERIERNDGVPKAEGNLSAAAAALRAKERQEAVRLLTEAVAALTALRDGVAQERKAGQAEFERVVEQRRAEEKALADARAKAEAAARAEAKAKAEQLARERAIVEAKAKAEADARAREAEIRARADAAERAKYEAAARARAEVEARARAEAAERARAEAQARARAEAAERARAEAQRQGLETFMGIMRGFAR